MALARPDVFAGAAAFPLTMGLVGGACAGAAYAFLRALRKHGMSPESIVLFFSAFSCIASLPLTAVDFRPMTLAQVLILVGAGAGAALGQFGITWAYRFAEPRQIAVYDYSGLIFVAAFGFLAFGQVPDAWSCLGFATIVSMAALLYARERAA